MREKRGKARTIVLLLLFLIVFLVLIYGGYFYKLMEKEKVELDEDLGLGEEPDIGEVTDSEEPEVVEDVSEESEETLVGCNKHLEELNCVKEGCLWESDLILCYDYGEIEEECSFSESENDCLLFGCIWNEKDLSCEEFEETSDVLGCFDFIDKQNCEAENCFWDAIEELCEEREI